VIENGEQAILRVSGLTKRYGGLTAVNNCSFQVPEGGICALIGPNGSGKSTTFDLISGIQRADRGEVLYQGRRINGLKPYEITRRGLCRTFQITRVFPQMTLVENMEVAASKGGETRQKARQLLDFVGLSHLAEEYGGNLSYGQQKLLEFARILMTDPDFIMLDEPFAGVNPVMEEKLVAHILGLQERGKTFLIIDHEMKIIMSLCQLIFVLDHGELIAEGEPEAIQRDERVVEAYFGK